jgi:hypothetical protein
LPEDNAYFILFTTIHEVLKVEKLFKARAVDAEVVPVPRKLSSDCGVCIKMSAAPETLGGILDGMAGVQCFVFDGIDYLPHGPNNGQ